MAKNFPELKKDIKPQIQKCYKLQAEHSKQNIGKKTLPRHSSVKPLKTKDKEKILETASGKNTDYLQRN